MPKRVEPLSISIIENAKPKTKGYKLSDGGGLYLLVTPTGGKLWRMSYRFEGKRKEICLKSYPERSLEEARNIHIEARQLLANAVDPLHEPFDLPVLVVRSFQEAHIRTSAAHWFKLFP